MTKTIKASDIIFTSPTEGYVVDKKILIKEGEWCINTFSKIFGQATFDEKNLDPHLHKIIYTLGTARIKGLPVIVEKDEVEELALEAYPLANYQSEARSDSLQRLAFKRGYKAAAQSKSFTEEDMRKMFIAGYNFESKNYGVTAGEVENFEDAFKEKTESLKSKQVKEIEVEMEEYDGTTSISKDWGGKIKIHRTDSEGFEISEGIFKY